ncbi:acyl carrier protein [Bacillus velezensis]|nr:acyl carrier protein [Bacillus velezensis]
MLERETYYYGNCFADEELDISYRAVEAGDDVRVIEDLGFSSLDIAQLVAQMEMETGVDPFSQGETISSITTVGSICDIYQKYMDSAQS